jgi:predicted secreted protein
MINRRMAAALAQAKAAANVTVTTTGYNVYQVRPEKGPAHREGRQGLHLESKDSAALLTLVGALQGDGLTISNFAASVSPEILRSVQDELTTEALHRVAQRAANIAATLDMRVLRYVTLQVGNTDAPPHFIQPMMRAAVAMAPAPAPPVAAAGEETVSVGVNAEVELAPKR